MDHFGSDGHEIVSIGLFDPELARIDPSMDKIRYSQENEKYSRHF